MGLSMEQLIAAGWDDAEQFTKWVKRDVAKNLNVSIKWLTLKKESHPPGPLALAPLDGDFHWNGLMIFDTKLMTVPHDTFMVNGASYHITFAAEQGLQNVIRLVCDYICFTF